MYNIYCLAKHWHPLQIMHTIVVNRLGDNLISVLPVILAPLISKLFSARELLELSQQSCDYLSQGAYCKHTSRVIDYIIAHLVCIHLHTNVHAMWHLALKPFSNNNSHAILSPINRGQQHGISGYIHMYLCILSNNGMSCTTVIKQDVNVLPSSIK